MSPVNMCAWSDVEHIPPNGVYVKSVQAFFRRRDAAAYVAKLADSVGDGMIIVPFVAHSSPRTRPERKSDVTLRRSRKDALNRTHARKNAS